MQIILIYPLLPLEYTSKLFRLLNTALKRDTKLGEIKTNKYHLPGESLDALIQRIANQGYQVFGPRKRDSAIVYDEIESSADLPRGWKDIQAGGHYRLAPTDDQSYFSHTVGPDSWKRFIFSPKEIIFKAKLTEHGMRFFEAEIEEKKRAFFGIRSCELSAIAIQDRVLIDGDHEDHNYAKRRKNLLFVAVNCARSADTCFCASLDTGPRAVDNFDLSLTEVVGEDTHYFCLEIGSLPGRDIVEPLGLAPISHEHQTAADAACASAAKQQRSINPDKVRDLALTNIENADFWRQLEDRCLSCGNCTMVCPTCFCSNVLDESSLDGSETSRVRQWDSCFNFSHSHLAGGTSVRSSGGSRYRQWFTHKLSSWHDQFGTPGCTGCGRCITWCPVGIDITEEAARLESESQGGTKK
jgi:ferredoxin